MCDPGTLLWVGMIAAAGAAGVEAYQGIQNSKAQADMADYESDVAAQNAELAEKQAQKEEVMAKQERAQLFRKHAAEAGEAKSALAATGIQLGSGSALSVEQDILNAYSLDAKNLDYDIQNRVWKTRMQGYNYKNQAAMSAFQAKHARSQIGLQMVGGALDVTGSALQGAASGYQAGEAFQKGLPKLKSKFGFGKGA